MEVEIFRADSLSAMLMNENKEDRECPWDILEVVWVGGLKSKVKVTFTLLSVALLKNE